jgi:hypothetical protein
MPNHQLIHEATFTSSNGYNKFINWVSSEFDLHLQDNSNGLDVFFPNGKLNIQKATNQDNTLVAKINFESNLQKQGTDIVNKIMTLYNKLANTSKININSPLI